jgi:hypothetical protein
MNIDNFLKGPVSSLVGIAIMAGSSVSMGLGIIPVLWEGCVFFGLGFLALFMRDEIPGMIKRIFEKKIKE